jgi:membrane protein
MNEPFPDVAPPEASRRRSVVALARELVNDLALLFRQEIALAQAEIAQNLRGVFRNTGRIAVGGGVALFGAVVLVAFLIVGLGVLLGGAYWLSSLIVAVLLLGGGAGLAVLGAKRIGERSLAPEATMESLRETRDWASVEVDELRTTLRGDPRPHREAERALREGPRIGIVSATDAPAPLHPGGGTPATRRPVSDPLYKRVLHEVADDDVLGRGAQVAYFMFTSLPPALLVLFALGGIFGGERLGAFITEQLQGVLPGSADDPNSAAAFVSSFVDQVVTQSAPGPLSIGLLLGLWAASAVFVALTDALNRAYDVEDDRSWFRRRAVAIGVMVGFLLLFLGGSLVLIAGPGIAAAIDLGGVADVAWSLAQWPLAFLMVVGAFFLVYYFLPNRDQRGCKGVLFKSSAIAAALWLVATAGFRLYIGNFGSYGETYGFVGAILVLLLWMYLTGIVILVGGEISSEMERRA